MLSFELVFTQRREDANKFQFIFLVKWDLFY